MDSRSAGRILLWVVVTILAILAAAQLMRRWDKQDPVIIQSYDVSADIASEVHATLEGVLFRGESQAPLGRVSMLPNGQLVVTAPASVQGGVRRLLGQIRETKPEPTPTIGFDLWALTATPGNPAQLPAELAEVEPAINAIRAATGPMNFELREKLSTVTRSGQSDVGVSGTGTQMQLRASLRRDDQNQPLVASEVEVRVFGLVRQPLHLEATVELRPGELFVIGQSAVADSRGGPAGPASQIYYILRARL